MDGSKTLGKDGFDEVKEFVYKMIDSYEISPQGTHIGVVEFSENPTMKIPFNKTNNPEELKRLVNEIKPSNKDRRNADLAFELTKKELLSPKGGSRRDVPQVVILVTAGKSTGILPLKEAVKPIRAERARIYVVSIGKETDPAEFVDIVADKKDVVDTETPEGTPTVVVKVVDRIGKGTEKSKTF